MGVARYEDRQVGPLLISMRPSRVANTAGLPGSQSVKLGYLHEDLACASLREPTWARENRKPFGIRGSRHALAKFVAIQVSYPEVLLIPMARKYSGPKNGQMIVRSWYLGWGI